MANGWHQSNFIFNSVDGIEKLVVIDLERSACICTCVCVRIRPQQRNKPQINWESMFNDLLIGGHWPLLNGLIRSRLVKQTDRQTHQLVGLESNLLFMTAQLLRSVSVEVSGLTIDHTSSTAWREGVLISDHFSNTTVDLRKFKASDDRQWEADSMIPRPEPNIINKVDVTFKLKNKRVDSSFSKSKCKCCSWLGSHHCYERMA